MPDITGPPHRIVVRKCSDALKNLPKISIREIRLRYLIYYGLTLPVKYSMLLEMMEMFLSNCMRESMVPRKFLVLNTNVASGKASAMSGTVDAHAPLNLSTMWSKLFSLSLLH